MKAPLHILTCAAVMMAAAGCCRETVTGEMLEASEEAIVRWAGTSANIELALCDKTDAMPSISICVKHAIQWSPAAESTCLSRAGGLIITYPENPRTG